MNERKYARGIEVGLQADGAVEREPNKEIPAALKAMESADAELDTLIDRLEHLLEPVLASEVTDSEKLETLHPSTTPLGRMLHLHNTRAITACVKISGIIRRLEL